MILLLCTSPSALQESGEGPIYEFTPKICKSCCSSEAEKLSLGFGVLRAEEEGVMSEGETLHP